ncbi:hypothetical protein DZF91_22140 [Actinomadura logoneensis]|uniref:Uncharacterized protein n=1 Tax=Actinomadura logoneensis TaxID=2293572 RepID=A0A372JJN8_9ACTN|nr:hypothetical protein [Actinomadura logoneensis]RFU39518.1 hypothetical protein DZF91_22140 [Actinomadura logoneensis]
MRSIIVLAAGALLLAGAFAAVAWSPEERHPAAPPPPGVTFSGDDNASLRKRVAAVIVRLRQRDAAGLADFDVDPTTHERSESGVNGAGWLITHFATPLQGPAHVEIREDDNNGINWFACLSYGRDRRKLRLTFVTYGKKGVWPDPSGGDEYAFPVHVYAELAGRPPRTQKAVAGLFCNDGEVLPPARW